jgi:DICT domain-containing protein
MKEMSARSGVSEGTLRMWEFRHDFPAPARLPSGHRRYSELDLERVVAVVQARRQGLSLRSAIERARQLAGGPRPSVFAALRDTFPVLQPVLLGKPALICLSRAIEDEGSVRAQRPLLFACFQHERFFRQVQPRWRDMARTAERAFVMADFPRRRTRPPGPIELPLKPSDPLMREWVVVWESPTYAACLAGFERAGSAPRRFETIWSLEAAPVREAARVCAALVAASAPDLFGALRDRLEVPVPTTRDELQITRAVSTRVVQYVTAWSEQFAAT